jgi:hypothetical protein
MLCTNVFYSKRLTKYYPNYLLYNVLIHCPINKRHFVFVLKQVVPILVLANISAIQGFAG